MIATTDGGAVAELKVGSKLGYNSIEAMPYDSELGFNSFTLLVLDENGNPTSENSLAVYTTYTTGAPEFTDVLGNTSNGIEIKYMDCGNGAQYEYQWQQNGFTVTLNDSIKMALMSVSEVETVIKNIVIIPR